MLPVVAVLAGVLFVHEDLYQHHILSVAIILFSAALGHERMRMSKRTKGST
jgi:threonine/homoserine efflux transporter RhtA